MEYEERDSVSNYASRRSLQNERGLNWKKCVRRRIHRSGSINMML